MVTRSKELRVRYVGDASGLQKTLTGVSRANDTFAAKMQATGRKISAVGSSLTRKLTLPLVGIGVVATKTATDYEDAFAKIAGLSNASAKQVAAWKDQVLQLAGKTAQAPQDLADALFFLASAGLKTNQIMPALEQSAKAASAGMGSMTDVAKLTANVLNAYAGSGLKAAQVTDTLAAAVREGSADPKEFASAMGKVLPIASKAGVTFDQVAASLATMSNIGLDVNEGTTALRGLLSALEAPGSDAAKALDSVGISADQLRSVIKNKGLLAALQLLNQRTHGNIDVMRTIVPNIRALTGAFALSGNRAAAAAKTFDNVGHASGSLDKAFDARKRTAAFQFQKTLTLLKVAAIKLGNAIIPIATKIAEKVASLAEWFSKLSPATQGVIVVIGAAVAALGPLISVIGHLVTAIGFVSKAFIALAANPAVLIWVVIAAAVIVLTIVIIRNWSTIKRFLLGVWHALQHAWAAVWERIKGVVGPVIAVIKALVKGYVMFVRAEFNVLKAIVLAVWNVIKVAARVVWKAITTYIKVEWAIWKGIFTAVKTVVLGVWHAIHDSAVTVWHAITNVVRGAWDGIVGIVKSGANVLISALNGVIKGLNAVVRGVNIVKPGSDLPSIQEIPYLARGGRAVRAGLGIVGEDGPELLTLPRGASVVPLGGSGHVSLTVVLDRQRFGHQEHLAYVTSGR